MSELIVYAVVYSNYYPREIDSLWKTEELAQDRADSLKGRWEVEGWPVLDAEKPLDNAERVVDSA